jgi:hypothetical protein
MIVEMQLGNACTDKFTDSIFQNTSQDIEVRTKKKQ